MRRSVVPAYFLDNGLLQTQYFSILHHLVDHYTRSSLSGEMNIMCQRILSLVAQGVRQGGGDEFDPMKRLDFPGM